MLSGLKCLKDRIDLETLTTLAQDVIVAAADAKGGYGALAASSGTSLGR
jgi:hypothetical protein